jgi:O-antigen ligase
MGIGLFLKHFGPLTLYILGIVFSLKALSGNVRWALMLMVFLLPLRNIIEKVQDLPLGNQFIDILLVSIIIGWIVHTSSKNLAFLQKSFVNPIAAILIIYTFISVVRGNIYLYGDISFNFEDHRFQDWKNFCLLPIFFYVTLNNTREKKDVWLIILVMCAAMFIMDYYTIRQISSYSTLISRSKISGTFQFLGPNEVAAFFNVNTIFLISVFYFMKKNIYKWMLLALILANLYCITFTYSRGAYAGLIVGMFVLFVIKDRKMLIPLILMLLFWQSILPEKVVARIKETKTESGQLDESSQRRIDIWHASMDIFKKDPITGIGFLVFRCLGFDLGDTHNIYVKLLTEQGVIGFVIFFIVVFCFMREGFCLYQKGEDELDRGMGLGLLAGVLVLLINNLFGDRWTYLEPNAYLWVFAGLVARLNVMPVALKSIAEKPILKQFTTQVKKKVRYYDL